MEQSSFLDKFKTLLSSSKNILVTAHPGADMDSLGSTLAMYEICLCMCTPKTKITPLVWEESNYLNMNLPYQQDLLIYDANHFNIEEFDLFIVLDIGDIIRLPIWELLCSAQKNIVVIDHHVNSCKKNISKINLILNYITRSTTKMLYKEFIMSNTVNITTTLAHNILVGLYGDTEFLTDVGISSEDFKIMSQLIESGADLDALVMFAYRQKSISKLNVLSELYKLIKVEKNFAYCVVDYQTVQNIHSIYGIKPTKHDILDTLRCLEGVDFGIAIFEDKPGFLTASLKSRTGIIDLEKFAAHFGGGGHRISAAFRFNTDNFYADVNTILNFLRSE